ncbi:16S rRNA (cytidine(1402)-2'-O)-methyltransferase [Buchnera aphidicola (Hormaphis cornu)]|nr:16S rRNA (cytidine(1402)-2'-O)-methyltransferase [Buchnera aphidicola (Hormaphis cornu)]
MKIYSQSKKPSGILYIVPTPIGNLSDITTRALTTLQQVNIIACENIKHSLYLLQHFKISTILISINQNNETKKSKLLVKNLINGKHVALISNAGSPLINDPGCLLVNLCHHYYIKIIPLPGPCAAITALVASGLPTNKFCYEGFLPSTKNDRCKLLISLKKEHRTLIFYETSRRILDSLKDIINELGSDRSITIAKELTKIWELIYTAPAKEILNWLISDHNRYKGEIVLIIKGYTLPTKNLISDKILTTFKILYKVLPLTTAVKLTAQIHKIKKNQLYQYTLQLKNDIVSRKKTI